MYWEGGGAWSENEKKANIVVGDRRERREIGELKGRGGRRGIIWLMVVLPCSKTRFIHTICCRDIHIIVCT
jgi:hypothetical protein